VRIAAGSHCAPLGWHQWGPQSERSVRENAWLATQVAEAFEHDTPHFGSMLWLGEARCTITRTRASLGVIDDRTRAGNNMPSIYDLKPAFQKTLRPVVRGLSRLGVTPNQVTLSALFLSLAAGLLIALWPQERWPLFFIPIALFLRMALNAIDGMLAREHNMTTKLGAVMNEIGDVASDTVMYLPLALVPALSAPLIVVVNILAIISEMTGVVGVQIGATRRYDGPMGKSDRAFVLGSLALLIALGFHRSFWLNAVLGVMIVLLALTIFNRARGALKEAEDG
jgi:CDP-diacylglycerol--glycerol-3-phosphate 3-phosphatidyltransferase